MIMPTDIHKQAIEKRNWQVEFERQAEEQKQREATLRLCLYKFLLFWILQIKCYGLILLSSTSELTTSAI